MHVCFPGHIAGRRELRSRDYPEGSNWHLCLQASFLPTVLQRATMMKCITYTSDQVAPLLKTCQGLLSLLRVNLISQAWHLHLSPIHLFSFPSLYLQVKSDQIFMWSLTYYTMLFIWCLWRWIFRAWKNLPCWTPSLALKDFLMLVWAGWYLWKPTTWVWMPTPRVQVVCLWDQHFSYFVPQFPHLSNEVINNKIWPIVLWELNNINNLAFSINFDSQ